MLLFSSLLDSLPFTHYFSPFLFLVMLLHGGVRAFSFLFSELWFPSINLVNRDDSNTFLSE